MKVDNCKNCGRKSLLENGLCSPCRSKQGQGNQQPQGEIKVVETKFVRDREIQFGRDEAGKEYSRFRYLNNNSGLTKFVNDGESPDGQRSQIRDTSKDFFSWEPRQS